MDFSKISWKTSALGLSAILIAGGAYLNAAYDNDPATIPDTAALVAAVLAGIGLLFARDNTKSSKAVGVK